MIYHILNFNFQIHTDYLLYMCKRSPQTIAFNVQLALSEYESAILALGRERGCVPEFSKNSQLYALRVLFKLAASYKISSIDCDITHLITVEKVGFN